MTTGYIQRFARLHRNVNRLRWTATTRHGAPHKPLLLLAVLDLFAEGVITANLIEPGPELGELFTLYWARVMPPGIRGDLVLPFFHLKYDGFWQLIARPGKEAMLAASRQIRSLPELRDTVLGACLDDELYTLLGSEEARDLLRAVLIDTYFAADMQRRLEEQGAINTEAFRYSEGLLARARAQQVAEALTLEEGYRPVVRDQGFRRAIVTAYSRRCALCGIRVVTADGHTAVDAGHIIPWSIGHDDDPRNGMAFCRLCHWAFDEGLCGVSSRYVIVVSPQLMANQNLPGHLLTLGGRGIIGPAEPSLWPKIEALQWHRTQVFRPR